MDICINTKFVFIVTSSNGSVEDRFLYDADYCIRSIHTKGVCLSDVIVATDTPKNTVIEKCPIMREVNFVASQHIISTIKSVDCENLIIIAGCHGSIKGIDAPNPIMPYPLTEAIKNNPSCKNVVVFFGQCYAGIYNWVDLRKENTNIVYLGATGFDSSLSCSLNGIPWCANISLIAFCRWLYQPIDIDGDGFFTVMDLYKYLVYVTNDVTHKIEKRQTAELVDAKVELRLKMKEQGKSIGLEQGKSIGMEQLEKEAIDALANYIVPHQAPWLLNAFSAQQIQFN